MTATASIFGHDDRTDATPSAYTESSYAFLRRAAGPVWDQCRALIDAWLLEYPATHRGALVSRLRTHNDREFASAFWELYLHESYRRAGWVIEIEPTVSGTQNRPDFLVSRDGSSHFVEARCTFEGGSDGGSGPRLQAVYDSINEIDSGAFYLAVTARNVGSQSPSTKSLRADLETWLSELDPDAHDYSLREVRDEHRYDWIADDWHLTFYPIPRSPTARAIPAQRPLGAFIPPEASVIDDIGSLRQALREKGSKYGSLPHPLVLAVNVVRGFHDERDTIQALYGTIGYQLNFDDTNAEATPVLIEQGYWGWPGKPMHTHVSGVLLAVGIHYGTVGRYAPEYWAHPHATDPVAPLPPWRVARPHTEPPSYDGPASPVHEYFGLSEGWPVGEPFPRDRQTHSDPA